MSSIKIQTITFYGTNPAGTYVAGDVIECFYDTTETNPTDVASGISVTLNGSPVTSGSNISLGLGGIPGTSPATLLKKTYGIVCNGTYGVQFIYGDVWPSFPYCYKFALQDITDCSISPIVCDLAFSPNVTTLGSSSDTSNDGSITVLATSSYSPIKYKLGSDFDYHDGSGQLTGTFSALYPGAYRIYARDSNNCGSNILVNLTVTNTYGVIYTINYINIVGHRTKIDILKRGYSSSSSDIKLADSGFQLDLRGEGGVDKFFPALATEATIILMAETNKQYQEFFTNDPRQYKVNFYKDTTGGTSYSLKWSGFVVPQVYEEQFLMPPYEVTVRASDGLPNLAEYVFLQDDGNKFIGTIKAISLIAKLLQKTGLQLNIRCGINLFADAMAKTSTDDPLDQAYVDVDAYYIADAAPTFQFVLYAIMKSFRARLVQADGVWKIIRPEECTGSFNYREFDYTGVYLSHSSYDPRVNIANASSSNRVVWRDQNQNLELKSGFGKLRINYHLGYKTNILKNGDFSLVSTWNSLSKAYSFQINLYGWQIISPTYPISTSYEAVKPQDLSDVALVMSADPALVAAPLGYIQSDNYSMAMGSNNQVKLSIEAKIPSPTQAGIAVDGSGHTVAYTVKIKYYYQKVRVRVYYGGKYLRTDGNWTNIPDDVTFYLDQFDQYTKFEITANAPDSTYTTEKTFNVKVFHSWSDDCEFTTVADLKRKITNSSITIYSDRGSFNASGGLFPSTGGSGGGGAILNRDRWTVTVAGIIQGITVATTVHLMAIKDSPGQDIGNWLIGDLTLSAGAKTEIKALTPLGAITTVYYYELQNNADTPDDINVIRPNDYDGALNPNQWILVFTNSNISTRPSVDMYINKIEVQYLENGTSPYDTIVRYQNGESNNLLAIEDDIYHGSLTSLVTTENVSGLISNLRDTGNPLNFQLLNTFNNKTIFPNLITFPITQSILSGKLIYSGFYRDSSGNGYDTWARVGFSESTQLHTIWLNTTMSQYNRSWRKITGGLFGDIFLSFSNILKDTIQDNILYLPVNLSFDDKYNEYDGEFLELMNVTPDSGKAFSTGFSEGFS